MNLQQNLIYTNILKKEKIEESIFKNFLEEAANAYYTEKPLISDEEFDTFRDIFKENYGYDAVKIGTNISLSKGFEKCPHSIPMGSLIEFSTKNDVTHETKKWAKKYADQDEFCTTEKLDGLSVSVEYRQGVFYKALTRGDGNEGDDITENVKKIKSVPNILNIPYTGFLRGEIVLKKSVKTKHFPHYANERNGAVGLIKRLDGIGCEHLDVFFFKLESSNFIFKTEYESLNFIEKELNLQTPRYYKTSLEVLLALHKRYETEVREKLDYLLDGLVVNINCKTNQERITENTMLPEYARKFKFASEEAITELVLVRTQVGRTGAITPLAILEPVACGGTVITKATLHNYDEIKRLGIKIGDYVKLVRSKDVIPKIVGLAYKGDFEEEIQEPKECPVCATPVSKEDTLIFCPNDYCSAKVSKALVHWLNVLNIKNISDKIVDSLIDSEKIKSIPDFYKLKVEDIANLEGQGVKNANKILNEIHSKKELTIAELLSGLNIRNLSVKRAEILEDQFNTLENILNLKTQDIVNLDGFEDKLATFITSGLKAKKNLINEILKHVSLKQKASGPLTGKSFCFSGFRDEKISADIKSKGGSISESFSKKITFLVVRNKNVTTSKTQKAMQYGTPVVDLNDIEGMLHSTLF